MALIKEHTNTTDSALENTTVHLQKEQNKITIDDVAKALGVSKTTVSRVLAGRGRIGEDTRQRVFEYIKVNHYRLNVAARGQGLPQCTKYTPQRRDSYSESG